MNREARRRASQSARDRARKVPTGVPAGVALGGAVDLEKLKDTPLEELIGEMADEAQRAAEHTLGLRCWGCNERIGKGWEVIRVVVVDSPEGPQARKASVYACTRKECEFVFEAMQGATAMRKIEWMFLDEGPGLALAQRHMRPPADPPPGPPDPPPSAGRGMVA